jgi:YjbE family integral membrane protein
VTLQTLIEALFKIVILDLVLSGDNAIVIGMAVRALPPKEKRRAILLGGAGALGLRMVFTAGVTLLVRESPPLLLLVGGFVLLWITYRLLTPESEEDLDTVKAGKRGFWAAMQTIIIADVTMSLDNVLAVGVAADGDVPLVLIGLVLSMAIIVAGGALVSTILARLPWLNYVGGLILLILAGEMIVKDPLVGPHLGPWHDVAPWIVSAAFAVVLTGLLYWRHRRPAPPTADIVPAADVNQSSSR